VGITRRVEGNRSPGGFFAKKKRKKERKKERKVLTTAANGVCVRELGRIK
jgi:hypothetical protein